MDLDIEYNFTEGHDPVGQSHCREEEVKVAPILYSGY
jgi:hypothetical protein